MGGEDDEHDEHDEQDRQVEEQPVRSRPAADPFERARAALRAAREARGADEDEEEELLSPLDKGDPLSRAQAALEEARRTRESGGKIQRAREERARAELEQLKTGGISRPAPSGSPDSPPDKDEPPPPPGPRKRNL